MPVTEEKNGIELSREFMDANGVKRDSFRLGDTVRVRLRFRSIGDESISNVAMVDMFPSGFEPDIASIREVNASGEYSWYPDYADIREDRLVLFGSVGPEAREFVYTMHAVNKGKFTVPPIFAEAMYDRATWAIKPQGPVSVTE
jgi:uncharacterized protein YfaS (alpha-2-macroglobulin family)